MIKTLTRFSAFLLLSILLVYAPEILTAVSAPYALHTPDRTLLRIALCCEGDDLVSSIYTAIQSYQKSYPSVHLRITRISEEQLAALQPPYPDVLLFPPESQSVLPLQIAYDTPTLIYAVHSNSKVPVTAGYFAAYLHEAHPSQYGASDF